MNNLQLLFSIGIPTLAILGATFLNYSHFEGRFNAIETRLIAIEADLRRFYEMWGKHEGELGILKERMK